MYFALINDLKGLDFYGDIPEIFGATESSFKKYEISEEERDFLMRDFVDPVNELCGSLLDFGDVDYFNSDQCNPLGEWLSNRLISIEEEPYRELSLRIISPLSLQWIWIPINYTIRDLRLPRLSNFFILIPKMLKGP